MLRKTNHDGRINIRPKGFFMYKNYKDLQVWQKSMSLVEEVYILTKLLPKEEQFGLISQLRRAAISIPSNIAEGYTRYSTKEYIKFLTIARGSTSEVETQLLICNRLHFLDLEQLDKALSLSGEISKILTSMITKLSEKTNG